LTHAEANCAELIAESPAAGFLPEAELSTRTICRVLGTGWPSRIATLLS